MKSPYASALILALGACAAPPAKEHSPALRAEIRGGSLTMSTIEDSEAKPTRIAIGVVALRNNSADASLAKAGDQLADLLSAELSKGRGYRVLERQRIEDIERELSLGDTGPVDQATAARIGKMIGANVMAFGSYSTLGKKALVTVRLVKVETGEVVGGVTERADVADQLDLLAEAAAKKIRRELSRP